MQWATVLLDKQEGVGIITLNRPAQFNALDLQLGDDLVAALEECQQDKAIRTIIIKGAGKAFCSGGDLAWVRTFGEEKLPEGFRQVTKKLNRVVIEIRRLDKPVIAAINGAVGGAGLSIAAACDLRIASTNARFKQAYTSVGLTPDGGWFLLVTALVGLSRASELLFFDPVIDAEQALQMGLVNKVVPAEELDAAALAWAKELAAGPTVSFGFVKNLVNESLFIMLERQMEIERRNIVKAASTRDHRNAIKAFFEKRKPEFVGE